VVPGQHGAELTDLLGVTALRGQLAGLDVRRVGVVEDGDDGGIIECGGCGLGRRVGGMFLRPQSAAGHETRKSERE
jgi:hypothetical protein